MSKKIDALLDAFYARRDAGEWLTLTAYAEEVAYSYPYLCRCKANYDRRHQRHCPRDPALDRNALAARVARNIATGRPWMFVRSRDLAELLGLEGINA